MSTNYDKTNMCPNITNLLDRIKFILKDNAEALELIKKDEFIRKCELSEHTPLKYIKEDDRLSLTPYPISRKKIMGFYDDAESTYWTSKEVHNRFDSDRIQWRTKLSQNDREFIKHILMIFAVFDKIINVNISSFLSTIKIPECAFFYDQQKVIENIHQLTQINNFKKMLSTKPF